jgi:hypothetical protein
MVELLWFSFTSTDKIKPAVCTIFAPSKWLIIDRMSHDK